MNGPRTRTTLFVATAAGLALLLWTAQSLGAVPERLHYQGYLTTSDGTPVNCPDAVTCALSFDLTFRLYNEAEGGTPLFEETQQGVSIVAGVFHVTIGSIEVLDPSLLSGTTFLGVEVNGQEELFPRQEVVSAAYALRAGEAETLSGTAAAGFAKSGQSCSLGDKVTGIGSTGEILCAPDVDTNATNQCDGQHTFLNGDGGCIDQQALSTGSSPTFAGVNAGGNKVTNVGAPTGNSDAATKSYVDAAAGGGAFSINHVSCIGSLTNPFNCDTVDCTANCPAGMKIIHSSVICTLNGGTTPEAPGCLKEAADGAGIPNGSAMKFKASHQIGCQALTGTIWCITAN